MLDDHATEPLRVLDYFPESGVQGVTKSIEPYFLFNRALTSQERLSLNVQNNGASVAFEADLDFDSAGGAFVPLSAVQGTEIDDAFDLNLSLEEEDLADSEFSTRFPEGRIFNLSTELECTQFGGSQAQARLLNSMFEPGYYPMWIMVAKGLSWSDQLPMATDLLIGPAYMRTPEGTYRIYRQTGFASVFHDVIIHKDGSFEAHEDGVFFPFDTPDTVVRTYIVNATLKGTFDFGSIPARIRNMSLTSVFPTRSLLLLMNESETYADYVPMLSLDVDLNGNGIEDSATFSAISQPEEIPLELWDP